MDMPGLLGRICNIYPVYLWCWILCRMKNYWEKKMYVFIMCWNRTHTAIKCWWQKSGVASQINNGIWFAKKLNKPLSHDTLTCWWVVPTCPGHGHRMLMIESNRCNALMADNTRQIKWEMKSGQRFTVRNITSQYVGRWMIIIFYQWYS